MVTGWADCPVDLIFDAVSVVAAGERYVAQTVLFHSPINLRETGRPRRHGWSAGPDVTLDRHRLLRSARMTFASFQRSDGPRSLAVNRFSSVTRSPSLLV